VFFSSFPNSLVPCTLTAPCASLWAWSARRRMDCQWCSCCDALLGPFSAVRFPEQGHTSGLMGWTVEVQVAVFSLPCMPCIGWNSTSLSWREKTEFFWSLSYPSAPLDIVYPNWPFSSRGGNSRGYSATFEKTYFINKESLESWYINTVFYFYIFSVLVFTEQDLKL